MAKAKPKWEWLKNLCLSLVLLVALGLPVGCSFGPKQLKDGRQAYNEAVRTSSDQELLLNIVRLRYLDTIEFLGTNSISAQLSFSMSLGGITGKETGATTNLGLGQVAWSSRPTFTFTPQRGKEFARSLVTPVPLPILLDLASSEWDISLLFRMFVQNVNGLTNTTRMVNKDFIELILLLMRAQEEEELYFGSVTRQDALSDPIPVSQVTGADLLEAAKAGHRFRYNSSAKEFVLTTERKLRALYISQDSRERRRLFELLRLDIQDARPIMVVEGTQVIEDIIKTDHISIDTRSVLDALVYLAGGVDIPLSHLERGLTLQDWSFPELSSQELPRLFEVRSSKDQPESYLAVQHRNHWFYLADDDVQSKRTFLILAELLRLALSPGEGKAPVLTLPVGGP
jgi:hypothetical protein